MRRGIRFRGFRVGLLAAGCLLGCAAGAFAQSTGPAGTKADAPGAAAPSLADNHKRSRKEGEHRFWDRENAWLFAGVGAARTLDYFS
ncbi:MAG: hypothetical protein WA619_09105, partial [Candidatus Acidiferrum sp.]